MTSYFGTAFGPNPGSCGPVVASSVGAAPAGDYVGHLLYVTSTGTVAGAVLGVYYWTGSSWNPYSASNFLPTYSTSVGAANPGTYHGQLLYVNDTGNLSGITALVYFWNGIEWKPYPYPLGGVTPVGAVVKMQSYTTAETTLSGTSINTTITANSGFTPRSNSSRILVSLDVDYDIGGFGTDVFTVEIVMNTTQIAFKSQRFTNGSGGGTRSSVLFPISGVFTNTNTLNKPITVNILRASGDDGITFPSGYRLLTATEFQV